MPQILRPTSTTVQDAGWTVAGAATAHEALADDDDATYVVSTTPGDVLRCWLAVGAAPAPGTAHRIRVRAKQNGASASPVQLDVDLLRGTVSIAGRQLEHSTTGAFLEYEWQLTGSEVLAIAAGYGNLFIELADAQSIGAVGHHVARAELEIGDAATQPDPAVQAGAVQPAAVQAEGSE